MIENFDSVRKQLSELADVINAFKSEAVQLRIVELIFGELPDQVNESKPDLEGARKSGERKRRSRQRRSQQKVDDTDSTKKTKTAAAGTGAVSALSQLATGTFFEKPRTINDIIEHCKHKLARSFKANEFSGKLSRMVRNGQLTREKNADGQYEYQKP